MQPSVTAKALLGRYELVAKLAAGGMGEIFLARLEGAAGFEKLFVVKRILPHLADDARFRSMLIDEARIASKLSHPNICQVYELGETDGELYIVMEYLEGLTLLPMLRHASGHQRPLELGMVACIIQQISEGLHHAHELRDRDGASLNIIHRDVTPSNIFITESGVTKVLDFGIAKAKDVSNDTQTGTIKGKHGYMAPEQLHGAALDRRVDVFAVGILLFEMLTLRRLFQRRTDYLTLQAVMEEPVPDVRAFRRDLSPALADALARALSRRRELRFDTMRQFGTAVLDAINADHRIWTAGQLADDLALRFPQEILQHRAAVRAAVQNVGVAPSLPSLEEYAVDSLVERDDDLPLLDGEDQPRFADGGATRVEWVAPPPRSMPPAQVVEVTPFEARARSAWTWIGLAIVVASAAAAGLAVLWRSNQQPQTVLVVRQERVGSAPEAGPEAGSEAGSDRTAAQATPPADAGAADAGRTTPVSSRRDGKKRDANSQLISEVAALRPAVTRCLGEHDDPALAATSGTVVLRIGPSGRVESVEILPAAVAGTALASCIKKTFSAKRFATQRSSKELTIPFSTKLRR